VASAAVLPSVLNGYLLAVINRRFSPTLALRLGKNIARIRKKMGISQDKLAERVDIGTRYMQRIEMGDNIPSVPLLLSIQKTLKADWHELFTGM
jgi:DNA-binding XRE family transcriptional regulator